MQIIKLYFGKEGLAMKKVLKALGIIITIAGALAAAYVVITKLMNKKQAIADPEENYVSCSCLDEEFISETVA